MGKKCRKYARARKNRLIKPKEKPDAEEKIIKAFTGKCSNKRR